MKQYFYLSLITIFFVACGNSPSPVETTSSDQLTETISIEEPILNDQPMNKENQEGSVEDIIKEFRSYINTRIQNNPLNFFITADHKNVFIEIRKDTTYKSYSGSGPIVKNKKKCEQKYKQKCFLFANQRIVVWNNDINPINTNGATVEPEPFGYIKIVSSIAIPSNGCPLSSITPVSLFTYPRYVIGTSVTRARPSMDHPFWLGILLPFISKEPFLCSLLENIGLTLIDSNVGLGLLIKLGLNA